MNRKPLLPRLKRIIFIFLLILIPLQGHSTEVRGRIDFRSYNGFFPMANAQVQLCHQHGGCLAYFTGYDGMYYFSVPSGNYIVFVNSRLIFKLFIPHQPYFDIQPLLGN